MLVVASLSSLSVSTISHSKPEPKRLAAPSLKLALNALKLPNEASMALASAPSFIGALALALLPAAGGAMHWKKNAWFHAPPALFLRGAYNA